MFYTPPASAARRRAMARPVGVAARPPAPVSAGRGTAAAHPAHGVDHFVAGDGAVNPRQAMLAQDTAFTAPTTFRLTQGTSTRPATGSHTRPSRFAPGPWPQRRRRQPGCPLSNSTGAAAAMALAAPTSAWQPPSAPARVDPGRQSPAQSPPPHTEPHRWRRL